MPEIQRILIGSVELDKTRGGKSVANLYSTDTRLQFPALRLFDLSALEMVGLDPNEMGAERVHRRFWAYYTQSEKANAQGNAYKDVEYLEPLDHLATTTSTDTSAIVAELRAIRALLEALVTVQTAQADPFCIPEPLATDAPPEGEDGELDEFFPRPTPETPPAATGTAPSTNGNAPCSSEALVAWLNARAEGKCMGVGHILYGVRKVAGSEWGWPISDDQAGWNEAAQLWLQFAETL